MAGYNIMRSVNELLAQHESSPPSFTIHLYPEHWTLNNGSKFLYNNQVASLLDDIRAQRIPADFLELFDAANLPFYDGCMIVELLDYRPVKAKDPVLVNPERSRVVLSPNSETLWADLCLMNVKAENVWTDRDALEVEARILVATAPPLCLDPDPCLTRIVNSVLRVSVPKTPPSLKRKAAAIEQEEEENDKARRVKISQYMNPRNNRSTPPTYRLLELLKNVREGKTASPPVPEPKAPIQAPQSINPNVNFGINPAALQVKTGHTPLPNILPASSNGVPAPPTALNMPNGQASTVVRQSPRPPSTIPAPPTAIPPHMQMYPTARGTPPPPTQTPRPPSSAANQGSPVQRPLSVAHVSQQAGPSITRTQSGSQVQSPAMQRAQIAAAQQKQALNALLKNPEQLMKFVEHSPNFNGLPPEIQQTLKTRLAQFRSMPIAQQQQLMQQARANAATPAHNASQIAQPTHAANQPTQQQQLPQPPQQPPNPHQPQQRNSPLPVNQTVASRSPMPANAQTVPQMTPQLSHPQPPQGYPTYPMTQMQNPYNNSHLRPVIAHPQHPHMVPNVMNGNPQAPMLSQPTQPNQEQAQSHAAAAMMTQQMPPQFAMYNYPQMGVNMQHQRVSQYPWAMGMGRGGIPAAMMQQHQQHQQQQQQHQQQQHQMMQMGAGKAGMQGT